jgi:hypothetical protein
MVTYQAQPASPFDPRLSHATDRIHAFHSEAHGERLAALTSRNRRPAVRVRLGKALIGLGAAILGPAGSGQPALDRLTR